MSKKDRLIKWCDTKGLSYPEVKREELEKNKQTKEVVYGTDDLDFDMMSSPDGCEKQPSGTKEKNNGQA